jgi:hypothetical protein
VDYLAVESLNELLFFLEFELGNCESVSSFA